MKLYALCKKTWAISLLVFVLLVSLTPVSQAAAFLSVAQALENQIGFGPPDDSVPEIPEPPSQADGFAGRPACHE